MRMLPKYISLICLFICAESLWAASATDKADSVISAFYHSSGMDYLTKEECDSLHIDSLLQELDASRQHRTLFQLERILIKSYIVRGEIRMAIALGDRMYSKARALSDEFGLALSHNAVGEVYTYTGRMEEADTAYEQALSYFDKHKEEDVHVRMLLAELVQYHLRIGNKRKALHYLTRLNYYPAKLLTVSELTNCYLCNVYYQLVCGEVEAARQYLDRIEALDLTEAPDMQQYLMLANARYRTACGDYEKALDGYNLFMQTDYAQNNSLLYRECLQEKADLLLKMGLKEEAYFQYGKLYTYINKSFEKNYPQEINQLTARFQADRLAYENERERIVSMRFYLIGCTVCGIVLLLFLFLGWKKIFRLKRSKHHREMMKRKAEQAIQRKNMFLSNMSHEVRTPLNAIVGFSEILTSGEDTFEDTSPQEFCEIIKVNSFQLLKLINDILDLSDFESDRITFNIRSHNIVKICRETIETVIASRPLQVEMRFETELTELWADADDSRLRQVLINLLVNAAKFTEQGSIVLTLKMADEQTALFTVTDTGCGIPLDKQKLVFERFEKLNDYAQGSGLGLSICRLIVQNMHGEIWVDSQYTEGARFCFTHPLKYIPEPPEKAAP